MNKSRINKVEVEMMINCLQKEDWGETATAIATKNIPFLDLIEVYLKLSIINENTEEENHNNKTSCIVWGELKFSSCLMNFLAVRVVLVSVEEVSLSVSHFSQYLRGLIFS